tara:strand:- start:282 stop:599 length:318 start_codon:yes stop_codon:yes gene_type:complete
MATIKWQIENMQREITQGNLSNVVTFLHWVCTANGTDNKSVSSLGKLKVSLGSSKFVSYENITEEIAVQWAKDGLGSETVEKIEASVTSRLNELENPTTASGVSW